MLPCALLSCVFQHAAGRQSCALSVRAPCADTSRAPSCRRASTDRGPRQRHQDQRNEHGGRRQGAGPPRQLCVSLPAFPCAVSSARAPRPPTGGGASSLLVGRPSPLADGDVDLALSTACCTAEKPMGSATFAPLRRRGPRLQAAADDGACRQQELASLSVGGRSARADESVACHFCSPGCRFAVFDVLTLTLFGPSHAAQTPPSTLARSWALRPSLTRPAGWPS